MSEQHQELDDAFRAWLRDQDEYNRETWEKLAALQDRFDSLLVRAAVGGLRAGQVAAILNDIKGVGRYFTAQAIASRMRVAELSAADEVERFVTAARVEAVMADRGVTEHEARDLVNKEERAQRSIAYRARQATREAAEAAKKERASELVAWVKAEGGGVTLPDDYAEAILDRIEPLRRPNAQTRRWVAERLRPRRLRDASPDERVDAMAARLIEHVRVL